jgi:hypothetical protein
MKRFKARQACLAFVMLILSVFLITGCGGGGGGDTGHWLSSSASPANAIIVPPGSIIPGAVCTVAVDPLTIPTVTSSSPTDGNLNATTSTAGVTGKKITATFSLAMNAATINATTFYVGPAGGIVLIPASVTYNAVTKVATLETTDALLPNTAYTVVITTDVTSTAGIPISCGYAWNFTTGTVAAVSPAAIDLGAASTYGIASRAGLTSTGVTVVNGNVALWPLGTCTDATGIPANCGLAESKPPSATGLTVNGVIRFPTDSDAGATATAVTTDLTAAWNEGMAKVNTQPAIAANQLGGKTFVPGVYENANLGLAAGTVARLDAQNDPDAVFIFKVTLGGDLVDSGTLLLPTRIDLVNGAQAKNVWFVVGRDITIGSGTTWNGTILANRTATVLDGSTVNGRVLAGAGGAGAVTLTGAAAPSVTTITVPLP